MNQDCFNTDEIINYLEITPPFLMIDHVEKIVPGKSCYAIKKLKQEDWFFNCHLEKEKLMPEVLQIEAMLQTLVLAIFNGRAQRKVVFYYWQLFIQFFNLRKSMERLRLQQSLIKQFF